jgi:hypothetical protein
MTLLKECVKVFHTTHVLNRKKMCGHVKNNNWIMKSVEIFCIKFITDLVPKKRSKKIKILV